MKKPIIFQFSCPMKTPKLQANPRNTHENIMKIGEYLSWPFNGIEKSHDSNKNDFHGFVVHGPFRGPLNSWPMKKTMVMPLILTLIS